MLSQTEIERTALNILAEFKPYLTPDRQLYMHTSAACVKPIVRAEFDAAISALLAKEPAQIARIVKDDGNKFAITSAGEARLLE